MEWTCAFKRLYVIILAVSKVIETETKEFYCTGENSWKKAMSTCLEIGGKPMSHQGLADEKDVNPKQRISVWTSDYIYQEIDESWPQSTIDYECGYMRFDRRQSAYYTYWYSSTAGVEYDTCSTIRMYFCDNRQIKAYGKDTWIKAYHSCKSPEKLWSGYTFPYWKKLENVHFWIKSTRSFIRETLKGSLPTNRHLVRCGTNEGPVNLEGGNNCEQAFRAVCVLENKTDDSRFTRSCLQEALTTTSSTATSTRKTTTKPTRATHERITTVEPSLVFTETFNGTGSLSPSGGLPKTIIIVITSTIIAVIICCIVTVLLFCFCRKRRKRDETHSGSVRFKTDNPSTASVVLSINNNPNDKQVNRDEADAPAYYEVSLNSKDVKHLEAIYSNETQTYDNKPTYTTAKRRTILETEYDTTNNVKVVTVPSNIYNKFGYETTESVYDISLSKPKEKLALDTDLYSKTCPRRNLESVNSIKTENAEYHYVSHDSENHEPPYKTARRRSISESDYDTTKKLNVVNESSNIYNKLGYETTEGIYDSTMSKPNKKPAMDTDLYSRTSPRENVYDATANGGLGTSRLPDVSVTSGDNIYGNTNGTENDDSTTYGNLMNGRPLLGTYADY